MPHFNPLIAKLSPPPVPSVLAWAKDYDGARGPLIDLSQAVPGYPAHPDMLTWLGEAAASPAFTGYGAIEGEDVLRSAYAQHVSGLYDAKIGRENIHITSGCNQAFICTAMAIAGAGDTILMTNPLLLQPADDAGDARHRRRTGTVRCGQRLPAGCRCHCRSAETGHPRAGAGNAQQSDRRPSIHRRFCTGSTICAAPTAPG